jgi:hypothetical protein
MMPERDAFLRADRMQRSRRFLYLHSALMKIFRSSLQAPIALIRMRASTLSISRRRGATF